MVGTSSGIMHVDLGGSSWVLVKIFTIKSSFSIRISFPCGYIGSKVNCGARGESVAGSMSVPLGCVDYLGGSVSLAESYHRCGGLVDLSLARSPRRLAPAFIHSPYRLGYCFGLVLIKQGAVFLLMAQVSTCKKKAHQSFIFESHHKFVPFRVNDRASSPEQLV